jgi:hypothetical protein
VHASRGPFLLSLLVVGLGLVACESSLAEGHFRWESIHGFAIWPEDHPEDGLAACKVYLDDEPWRADAAETAIEFLRTKLGWARPEGDTEIDYPEDAPRTGFTMTDASEKMDLGVVVHVRQMRGCWFVATIQPREGYGAFNLRWMKDGDDYSLRVKSKESGPMNLEVGWGDEVVTERMKPGEALTIPTPDPEAPGHLLWYPDGPSENTTGHPLSPPPRIP